jgi:hypothetical protein
MTEITYNRIGDVEFLIDNGPDTIRVENMRFTWTPMQAVNMDHQTVLAALASIVVMEPDMDTGRLSPLFICSSPVH